MGAQIRGSMMGRFPPLDFENFFEDLFENFNFYYYLNKHVIDILILV